MKRSSRCLCLTNLVENNHDSYNDQRRVLPKIDLNDPIQFDHTIVAIDEDDLEGICNDESDYTDCETIPSSLTSLSILSNLNSEGSVDSCDTLSTSQNSHNNFSSLFPKENKKILQNEYQSSKPWLMFNSLVDNDESKANDESYLLQNLKLK